LNHSVCAASRKFKRFRSVPTVTAFALLWASLQDNVLHFFIGFNETGNLIEVKFKTTAISTAALPRTATFHAIAKTSTTPIIMTSIATLLWFIHIGL
jgi:hypothetical protein